MSTEVMSRTRQDPALRAQTFDLEAQLLSKGRARQVVAKTDTINLAVKVYAEGGENTLHAHADEDHIFVIADGEATFYDRDGNTTSRRRGQGILIPAGYFYRFHACGGKPLVMLRIGTGAKDAAEGRLWVEGVSEKQPEGSMAPVPIPGSFWTL